MADPLTIAAVGAFAGSSLLSFTQTRSAGAIASKEAEVGAQQEELAAIQREGDRKQRLAQSLATQTAGAGASGIAVFEGSPLSTLQESIRAEETATERDQFMSRLSSLTTRTTGRVAASQAKGRATVGLLGNVTKGAVGLGPLI